nr:YesL family protein [uncultured Blautia sp.]
MKRFFGTDSPLFRFMTILLELAEINLLFILCSVPIVTIGASYAAMTDSMNEMHVHGEGCFSAKRFFQVFKKSLKPMIPIGIVILACCVGLGFASNYVLQTMEGTSRILFCGIYVVLFLILSGIFQYSAFIAAKTEKWNKDYLKNSFLLALAKFPLVILTTLLSASVLSVLMMSVSLMFHMLPVIFLFWFSCPAYVCVGLHRKALKPLLPELFSEEEE